MPENTPKTQRKGRGSSPNSRANLKPAWGKGESGNPAGPEPGYKQRGTILREIVDLIADFQNPITKENEKMPVERRMEFAIVGKAMKGDVQAYREIKDTLYGKVADKSEITGADGGPVDHKFVVEVVNDGKGGKRNKD
jgi:hypothetical protein